LIRDAGLTVEEFEQLVKKLSPMSLLATNPPPATSLPSLTRDGRAYRIFLLRGRMRSGTNWTCALLNLHPKIACHGEFHFELLREGVAAFAQRAEAAGKGIGAAVASEARAAYLDIVQRCLATKVHHKPHAAWIGDRTPAPIDTAIPGAPVINIVRDGRDAVLSWARHRLGMDLPFAREPFESWRQAYRAEPGAFDRDPGRYLEHEELIRQAVANWRDHVRSDLDIIARARRGEVDTPVLELSYERLHEDTEGARREMYAFLGVDPAEAAPLDNETVAGLASGRGRIGAWREAFTDGARRWFNEEAGELLIELGYEKNSNW
jgi:hypothetical protein